MKDLLPEKLKFEHYVLVGIAVLVTVSLYLSWQSPLSRAIRNGERVNGVIIGTDWVDHARHSDTLIFASYDPGRRFLDIVSVPRDTRFSPQGYTFRKINEIYAYHFRTKKDNHQACHEVRLAVGQLFDNRMSIPYYLQVDYASFRKVIDIIGGVPLDIEESMHYDDNAGKLHIHFEPGRQHLDGQKALEYVRYRGRAGDINRVFRQQRFFKAALARWKNPLLLARLPQVLSVLTAEIGTNLTTWELLVGALELKDLNSKNIRLAQLPGTPRRDLWEIDQENRRGLMDRIFPSSGTVVSAAQRVRVEVWNASGRNGLAERVSWMLRKKGYDVIDYGTFSTRQKKTLIQDLTGDLRAAQNLSDVIDCGEVVTRYDTKRLVDISVYLGEDCQPGEESKQAKKHR